MSKPRFIAHDLPDFQCPACLAYSTLSDPYGIDEGFEHECGKCGVMCEATDVEIIKTVTWGELATEAPTGGKP